MAIRYQDENGNWVTEEQTAVETTILDISGNFESSNVEGALRELAEKTANAEVPAELEAQVKANTTNIKANASNIKKIQQQIQDGINDSASSEELNNLSNRVDILEQDMTTAKEDIEYLKVNGGGGGGSAVPTIKSDFTDCAIDKGTDVIIPIFFSSPNMGDGTAYILVNNIQVDSTGIKQGNNNVRVKAQYLTNTDNKVAIYAKDRAGIVTNQLSWTIIAGGIELTSTFDYEIDYGITDTIRIPYTIDTGISGSATLHFTIDNNTTEYACSNGTNYIDINASDIGLGTHPVSMYATIDKYTSRTLSFNIVIISTTELYLSSTFISGSEFTYGELVSINYRLSKLSTEEFNVYLKIDDVVKKTQKLTVGSYFWTLNNLSVGPHKITIQAVSLDYSEDKSIDLELTIVEGEYTPVEDYTLGLLCDLNAVGRNNDDDAVINQNKWIDASGNGHDGQLINFNFGTNGFVNDTLVCDNDAYVVIPWSPWEDNALNGSTFDIIYTPINSGVEDCRVLDYTQITDDLSTDEIKPFKGIFADVLRGISSSASSGASAGKVNLDDENGEIHLTWVLDRTNKFMKTYIDGVLCRIMFLTDSGAGVNKFYEDFSLDEYIYLNSTKGLNCGTNNIKRFRVYDHALTSEQVLQNHLANITDLDKQKQMYDFNYNNTTLPKMYLNGDITNMTAYQTVPMSIEYISPNEERYGQSFNTGIQNNPVKIQGTSSLQYVRKNYTIYLKDEYGADMYYNPYGPGSVADYVFCLKADYVESSHANNTGCARFVNDCLYDTKTPMQLDNENCRTTINGFPIEVYMNGEYLGVYNFNHDRYSYQSYGYDYKKYPNMLVYEINSNSNTSAGAFYRYGDNVESSTGITELEYYKRDFNLIYGNRTTDSDTYSEIKTLVEWVSVAEQDLFRETISEHFNTEYLFRYFLMVLLIGAVDSLGKNLKIMTIDGKVWYPTFYDMDTVLGIDNTGYLTIEPDVEIESGSYNTSNSNLWNKVWNFFRQELKEEWSAMRQGRFTLDNLMDYIYGQQISVIPPKYYNDDAEVKYLQFGSLYTYCCHGNKEHQIRRWLRERIAYVDSMLGYFTSQEDQVTIRMNKTGHVSFDITTYIPLYFSVKWSNATGGTQTFKMKRGETKTFYYTSTTSTDQEVIIYHAQYIKALDNLSNLNPSSCILANARKLTNVEIHSTELYNINVTNNTFLRTINLENCSTLGTVTATGSSLNLSNCKYLRYCNVYNTALTEVQLNTSGGSLIEILYPKTIQSINLIKQRLLEKIGLPYGSNGEEIPTSLYTISIQECPSIKYLNTSDNDAINSTFASMVYCNNLTIRNSLDLRELDFNGFYRLKNVIIENMYNLEQLGFNNLLPAGDQSTLQYMGLSNCPLLKTIELNCTSNDYEITLADNAILNFGGLFGLQSIESNCVLKGLKTIIVPQNLESMYFTTEYGTGYSSVKNIWVSSVCSVNTAGATVKATHVDSTFEGIDFAGMHLKNIDLGALVNIPKAQNFSLSPTTVNPHFNLNRDGETYPYLQPVGTLDLSNYTESLARFFDGVDLDKLKIVCTNKLPQTDLSYCFYNSTFSNNSAINTLLSKVSSITNLDYCFYRTTIDSVDILDEINMGASSSMNYTFAECPNIKTLNNVVIPSTVTSVEGMFNKCPLTTITNMIVNVIGSISGLFKGCNKLTTINTLRIPNVTDVSGTFEGCTSLSSLSGFELPNSCTNVSNLFNGCYSLTELSMNFGSNITVGDNWYPPNLERLYDSTIANDYINLTGCSTLKTINNLTLRVSVIPSSFFNGCTALETINYIDIGGTLRSVNALFKDMKLTSLNNVTFSSSSIIDYSECFRNVQCINSSTIINFPTFIDNNISMSSTFNGCKGLTSIVSLDYSKVYDMTAMYWTAGITSINDIQFAANKCDLVFGQCLNLSSINNVSFPNATTMRQIFYRTAMTNASLTIPDSCTNISEMFRGCTNLTDISGMTFGSGITSSTDYIKDVPLVHADDITIKSFVDNNLPSISFKNCTTLVSAKNLKLITTLDTVNISGLFQGCTKLEDVNFVNPPKLGYCNSAFESTSIGKNTNGIVRLHEDLGISASCLSGSVVATSMFYGNSYIKEFIFPDEEIGSFNSQQIFGECINLKIVRNLKSRNMVNTFRFCRRAGDVELINCYITAYFNTDGCEGITKLTNCTIPDHITNIDNFFKDMRITDISGLTIGSGVTSATDWITNCPITTANNVTIKNNSTWFNGCSSLVQCLNLNLQGVISLNYFFSNCSNLTEVSFSPDTECSKITSMASSFSKCSKLTNVDVSIIPKTNTSTLFNCFAWCSSLNSIELNIPDTCTNIQGIFQMSGINDISGSTFGSGITNATNWKPPGLTTANNVTINNNNVNFYNCTTLIECKNLIYTGDYVAQLFSRCENLIDVTGLTLPNPVTMGGIGADNGAFAYTTCLKKVDFANCNLTKVTNMSYLFYCDLGKTITIDNFLVPNSLVNYTGAIHRHDFTFNNLTIDSKAKIFKQSNTGDAYLTFNGVTITENVTDLSSYFEDATKLRTHIDFPSHITNCEKCYKGCTGLTHISSNWNRSYTNGITSTDCYAGCTGITHIDDVNVITSEYVEGLDEIPESWGGYDFSIDNTGIAVIEIPEDKLTFELAGVPSGVTKTPILKVSWGDGTSSSLERIHTYSSPGSYIVKVKYDSSVIPSGYALYCNYSPSDSNTAISMRDACTNIIQVPINTRIAGDHFRQCSKLKTIKLDRAIINSEYLCYYCIELERVDLTNCTITSLGDGWAWRKADKLNTINLAGSTIYNGGYFFYAAIGLTTILGLDTANFSHNTSVAQMFYECRSLPNVPPLRTLLAPGAQPTDLSYLYYNCMKVNMIDISGVDFSEATNLNIMFAGDSELTNIIGFNEADFGKVTQMDSIFSDTPKLAIPIDFSNVNRSEPVYMANLFKNCGATSITGLSGIKLSQSSYYTEMFKKLSNATSLDISGLDTSLVENFTYFITDCAKMETVDVSGINTSGAISYATHLEYFCSNMPKLKNFVSKNASVSNISSLYGCLRLCPELTDVDVESWDVSNVGGYGEFLGSSTKLTNFKSFKNINGNISFAMANNLTVESLLSIINALKPTTETKTLTLGSINKAKLTAEQIKIATDKGWTVA